MNQHDQAGEQSATVGGMRRSPMISEIRRMAAMLALAAAVPLSESSDRQQRLDFLDGRRRVPDGQYDEKERAVAAALQAERQRRKAENWAKRQPKGKA